MDVLTAEQKKQLEECAAAGRPGSPGADQARRSPGRPRTKDKDSKDKQKSREF